MDSYISALMANCSRVRLNLEDGQDLSHLLVLPDDINGEDYRNQIIDVLASNREGDEYRKVVSNDDLNTNQKIKFQRLAQAYFVDVIDELNTHCFSETILFEIIGNQHLFAAAYYLAMYSYETVDTPDGKLKKHLLCPLGYLSQDQIIKNAHPGFDGGFYTTDEEKEEIYKSWEEDVYQPKLKIIVTTIIQAFEQVQNDRANMGRCSIDNSNIMQYKEHLKQLIIVEDKNILYLQSL